MRGKYLGIAVVLAIGIMKVPTIKNVSAESCPDLQIVFVRGSGGIRWIDDNYQTFKTAVEEKLRLSPLNYEFIDLDYPAVGVGMDNLEVTIGALASGGEAYEFGESVNAGVKNLVEIVNGGCSTTKYVIGGYSQGAMVISKALAQLNANRIIYAATFGDPKIYLPEGEGVIPVACKGENLSDYRMYVPDCQAYKGLLGAYIPYEPLEFKGKLGTWCNKSDIFCSSHLSISDHSHYMADGLYEDAAKVIYDKITDEFGIENNFTSLHDTAILIDSTGSMSSLIKQYKAEALRLANETFESGGRVALYDYRDLADPYEPVERCNFENCTLETFEQKLAEISIHGGGDGPESLLSASLKVMKNLTWKYGATKSLVVLTDADFLAPDRDGVTLDEVIKLSKEIDPVNFYIITNSSHSGDYTELAEKTDGKVVTNFDDLSLLTDYIMERYDSLPRVEEMVDESVVLPLLEILGTEQISSSEISVDFATDGEKTLVILNEMILGITNKTEIVLTDIDRTKENILTLVPILGDKRGEGETLELVLEENVSSVFIPGVPDTGIIKK